LLPAGPANPAHCLRPLHLHASQPASKTPAKAPLCLAKSQFELLAMFEWASREQKAASREQQAPSGPTALHELD